jgi:hypothetical protein
VWDILEREVRLDAPDIKDRPRAGSEEYRREILDISRLQEEMEERGTPRDHLISDLFYKSTAEPTGTLPTPSNIIYLSLEKFRQFRSKVEPMSDDEIREEIRKAKEEYKRREDEIERKKGKKGAGGRLPGIVKF